MRALLDLIRENETRVQEMASHCAGALELSSQHLTILDEEVGEQELIEAVAAALANLRMLKALTGGMVPPSKQR